MNITGMLALGNNEPCPYCKGADKFILEENGKSFLTHLQKEHPKEFAEALFGNK